MRHLSFNLLEIDMIEVYANSDPEDANPICWFEFRRLNIVLHSSPQTPLTSAISVGGSD